MTRPIVPSSERGFTLIELMVALLIFSLLAAAGTALLAFSVRAQGVQTARLDDIGALNRLAAAMSADFAQATARPTRQTGGGMLPPFIGEAASGSAPMVALVREGWTNLDGAPRAEVQKVEYELDDGRLLRIAYPRLDGAAPYPASPLMDGITGVALRYRFDGAWSDHWEAHDAAQLPQAVEMVITRRDGRRYRQLFLVGTDYRPDPQAQGAGDGG